MNEQRLEYLLHDALIMAAAERYEAIPDREPAFGKKYQKKFAKMLKAPFDYARKCQRTLGQQVRRLALVAVLVLAVLTAGIFAVPQTRSIAIDLIRQWFSDHITFTFSESVDGLVLPKYEITYLPAGYELFFEDDTTPELNTVLQYENANKDVLRIDIFVAGEYFSTSIDTEHCDIYDVKLENGIRAQMFEAFDPDWPSNLVWTSKEGKLFFLIHGKLPPEELLKIANGIVLE